MAHIYETGTRAWQPDTTEGWVASEVVDKQIAGDKVTLVFQLENGEVRLQDGDSEGNRVLTMLATEKISRDYPVGHLHGQGPQSASAHEPGHARSQRRLDQPVTFERACWYES